VGIFFGAIFFQKSILKNFRTKILINFKKSRENFSEKNLRDEPAPREVVRGSIGIGPALNCYTHRFIRPKTPHAS